MFGCVFKHTHVASRATLLRGEPNPWGPISAHLSWVIQLLLHTVVNTAFACAGAYVGHWVHPVQKHGCVVRRLGRRALHSVPCAIVGFLR
jgi:hypothetical protein